MLCSSHRQGFSFARDMWGCFLAYFAINSRCTPEQCSPFLTCSSRPPQRSPVLEEATVLPLSLPALCLVIWALPHPPPPPLSSAGQAALSSVGDLPVLLSAPSPCSCVCVCDHLAVFQKGKNPSPSMLALLALPNTQQECCGYAWSPSVKPDSPRTGSQLTEWLLPTQHTVVEEEKSCFTTRLWRKSGKVLG